jgi:hypothetical protein
MSDSSARTIITAVAAGAAGAVLATALSSFLTKRAAAGTSKAPALATGADEAALAGRVREAVLAQASALRDAPAGKLYPPVATPVKQLRILVSGGAGFVGSNLVDVLMMQVRALPPRRPVGVAIDRKHNQSAVRCPR